MAASFPGPLDEARLPELFCGFPRLGRQHPVPYPVACRPQAWASGVVFQLIQACVRLKCDLVARRLIIDRPTLPPFLTTLHMQNVELPFGSVDLLFERHAHGVDVTVPTRRGEFDVRVAI